MRNNEREIKRNLNVVLVHNCEQEEGLHSCRVKLETLEPRVEELGREELEER